MSRRDEEGGGNGAEETVDLDAVLLSRPLFYATDKPGALRIIVQRKGMKGYLWICTAEGGRRKGWKVAINLRGGCSPSNLYPCGLFVC